MNVNPERRSVMARIAAVQRHHGPDDPRLPQLHTDLVAVDALAQVRRLMRSKPRPTPTQVRSILAELVGVAS